MPSLQSYSTDLEFIRPADEILMISFELATVKSKIKMDHISDLVAMDMLNVIHQRLEQWPVTAWCTDERWQYHELQVDDSPHVWNGMVHAYSGLPMPSVWNSYRSLRIIVTNMQHLLSLRVPNSTEIQRILNSRVRATHRQMTNDICATIPCQLGHASPAYNSPHVLVTAYNSIWPLLLAANCASERVAEYQQSSDCLQHVESEELRDTFSAAKAQMIWILNRFDYISNFTGIRWAISLIDTLPRIASARGVVH